MELRSCHRLHFIQSIKGGSVIKILNVNHGRPALKFKKIEDIYESGDARNHDSLPTFRPREEFEELLFNCDVVERITKSDPEGPEFNCCGGGDGRNSDLDGLSFGNMTLKQIKERCRAKKRKLPSYVDSSKETVETCSHLRPKYLNSQPKDDECDLNQPLSCWKSKLSKKMKGKKKCMKNRVSTSFQTAPAVVKSEPISSDNEFLQFSGDLPAPIDIKVVVPEPDYSDCRDMICVALDPSAGCNEQMDPCGWLSSEVPEIVNDCVLATGVSLSSTKESQCCAVDEVAYEDREHSEPNSVYDVGISGWEIVKVDIPEIISHQYPDLPRSEFDKEGYIIHPLPHDIFSETVSPTKDHSSDMYDNFLSYSSMHEMSLQTISDSQALSGPMTFDNSLQCLEYIDGGSACLFEDETRNDLPPNLEARAISLVSECRSSWNFNSCLSPDSCSVSAADDSPSVEEKQSLLPACADIEKNCSTTIHPCDATDKLTMSAGVGDHQTKLLHPPERLFSTRKFQAISPTSQARLCKAMESIELHDNEQHKCRAKLYFGKQTKNKIIRAEGPGQIRGAEVSTNRKQFIRKPKYDTEGSHPKGILKDPHHSHAVPCFSTECSSIQSCSQSAIAFSQRQMRDIECLATRLTKELNSMKDIVKETLYFEACSATALKHNVDKVTMAIENATKVEESGKRFLSMMARDCSRFCKIMRLSEDDSAASNNVITKKRKKITFADEAGKKLCHVKIFEDDPASLMESSHSSGEK